jgi:hypothetical protein
MDEDLSMGCGTIRWTVITAYSEYRRNFGIFSAAGQKFSKNDQNQWFSAPQAKFFQKMIKINDFFIKIVFSCVYLIYLFVKYFHNHEKLQKMIKNFKNFENVFFWIFFSKKNEKNMSGKNWFLPKIFQKSNSEASPEFKNGVFVRFN